MLHPHIQVKESPINGKGLFATDYIPCGSIIWQLDAHDLCLTYAEVLQLPPQLRYLPYQAGDHFILCLDGSEYMNHSCDPNTWLMDDDTLIARYDISLGDEVTYDYATTECDSRFRPAWECLCGADNCRRIITPFDCLSKNFQATYGNHLSSWVLAFIQTHRLPVYAQRG